MSDSPFAEPEDDDKTLILPRPPGRAPALAPGSVAESVVPPLPGPERFADLAPVGKSPIVSAAAPLLTFLCGFHNAIKIPDPAQLRERMIVEIRRYEQALRDAKLPLEQIRTSHYALCASLDDVVQNTPWGSRGPWADASLVSTFHQEVRSGERFFDLLSKLCQNAGKYLPVIELMYLCMSLGMQGRYRLSPRGPAELDRVREETYLIILRQRGAAEPALSPHWRGIAAPFRAPRTAVPLWLAALAVTGLLGLFYALISLNLNATSDRLFARGLALPPRSMPDITRTAPLTPLPPAPLAPGPRDTIASCLDAEIKEGLVSLVGTASMPVVRVQGTGMFASGSATLQARFEPILARVAGCLRTAPGPLQVLGYTDDQPVHTVAFPSNFQLSEARAKAAAGVLSGAVDAGRVTSAGRAEADPIESNATADGRQANRRVEIVVHPAETPQ